MNALNVAFGPQIAAAAARHGLDPRLLAAVAAQETGGPGATSGRNVVGDGGHGRGLFQIDDRWHAFAATPAAMDPAQNADYAAGMLSGLLTQNGGDLHRALSSYNAGDPNAQGTITAWPDGRRLGYADSVMRHYAQIQAQAPADAPATATTGACPVDEGGLMDQLSLLQSMSLDTQPQTVGPNIQPQTVAQMNANHTTS
ncbi:MAG: transglycosylase SLT domain-containing protein, partial [Candidatus Eremiobacteraeota bacterium]|nr:transglycosylase SLT domain-containing protein [Candidatus Eremiobacteraeota bacterium]